MARVVGGERGGRVLLNESFRYHHNRTARDKIYWKCWRPHCRAGLQTNVFDRQGDHNQAVLVLGASPHIHGEEGKFLDYSETLNRMRLQIRGDPTLPIRAVYDREVVGADARGVENVPAFHSVRSTLNRTRMQQIPPIPANFEEVLIEGVWATTQRESRFLLEQDNFWQYVMFATDQA
ncbi:hypothetical protein V1264_002861 [Littorina saxatilis]|uniref:FLYWCH-type domain-containing protein n=1 Tax=Littorina saxatilis TaxID=31220 RepID=A0AAN9B674_9CAEN